MVKRLFEITLTAAVVIFSCRGGKCNGTHHRGSGGSNHNNDRSEIYPRIEATNSGSGTRGAKIAPRVNVAKATKAAATTIVTTGAMAATTPPLPLPPIAQSHTLVVTLAPLTPLLSTNFIHIRGCVGNRKMFNLRQCKTSLAGQSARLFVPRSSFDSGKNSKIRELESTFEHIELPAKLLDYFLRSNKSTSINQNRFVSKLF
jgi:hypothetical protein